MLGEILAKQKQYAEAKNYYQTAIDQDSTRTVYHIRLGAIFLFLSEIDNAYKIFAVASAKFPDVAETHYLFAIAARAKGDYSGKLLKVCFSCPPIYANGR